MNIKRFQVFIIFSLIIFYLIINMFCFPKNQKYERLLRHYRRLVFRPNKESMFFFILIFPTRHFDNLRFIISNISSTVRPVNSSTVKFNTLSNLCRIPLRRRRRVAVPPYRVPLRRLSRLFQTSYRRWRDRFCSWRTWGTAI